MLSTLFRRSLVAASAAALVAGASLVAGPAAAAAPAQRPINQTATFPYFAVTVQDAATTPEYDGYLVKLRVCVRRLPPGSTGGRTRISWDPWTVTVGGRTHRPSAHQVLPRNAFPGSYATQGRFRVGECAAGWLPFRSVKAGDQVTSVNYANSLGNRARWRPEPAAVGTKVAFPHFTVKVTAAQSKDGYFGVRATTCVRSVPAGRRTVRVSWDPWRLRTAAGLVRPAIDHYSPWADIYRSEVPLAKGQCESGWLVFPVNDVDSVTSVGYRNSLGDRASWRI